MESSRSRRLAHLALVGMVPVLACSTPDAASLSAEDERRIRALEDSYANAWLRGDTAGVLATLAPDVVLMPAGGQPIEGIDAAREFWWPDDGSVTTITSYETTIDEIRGNGSLAYVRGAGELAFIYQRDTVRIERSSRNMSLSIMQKGGDDTWRITHRMWAPLGQ